MRSAGSSARPHSTASVPSTPVKPSSVSPSLETFQPKLLISCAAGFPGRQYSAASGVSAFSPLLVPQVSGANGLDRVTVRFFPEKSLLDEPNEPEMSSPAINEPPSTPKRTMSGLAATRPRSPAGKGAPSSTIAVNSILLGRDSAFALCPLTLVTQAEALIASSKVEEALAMLAAVGTPDTPEKVQLVVQRVSELADAYLFRSPSFATSNRGQPGRTYPRRDLRKQALCSQLAEPIRDCFCGCSPTSLVISWIICRKRQSSSSQVFRVSWAGRSCINRASVLSVSVCNLLRRSRMTQACESNLN